MSSAENGMDPQAITEGEGPFQVQHEGFLPPSVMNTPDFLRRCRIAGINLQTLSAYRSQLMVGLNSLMACAVLPSSMSFDLAMPRYVNENDYCQRVADFDVMPEHDAPEDVSLAPLCLSKPILRVGADGMPRAGASTTDRDFEVSLGWTAQERKARHHIEAMVGWHHPEALSVRRDYARRVYGNLPMFWEEWEVPFSFRAETAPLFAYRGFALNYYGSDDHRWWIALSEHAALCLKALYLEVMERSGLYCVPDNVRRAWRIMSVEGILEGVQSEVTEKVIRLVGYVERILWRVADRLNRQPPMNPGTFTPVYDNGDWVHFDVTQWAPVVPSSGMVAHAPVTESDRVAFQKDRVTLFYGNTRSWRRYGYPEGIPAHDDDMRKPGRYGLTRKPMKVAERELCVVCLTTRDITARCDVWVWLRIRSSKTSWRCMGSWRIEHALMMYFSRRSLEGLRIIGGWSRQPVLLLLKGMVRVRQGLKVETQDQSLLRMSRWLGIQARMCRSRKHAARVGRSGVVVRLVG